MVFAIPFLLPPVLAHRAGLHVQFMMMLRVCEACHVLSLLFFIVAVASPQFTWPDEENVLFMRLCTEVFFEQMALVATLEFR